MMFHKIKGLISNNPAYPAFQRTLTSVIELADRGKDGHKAVLHHVFHVAHFGYIP